MGQAGDGWIMETICTIEVAHMSGIQRETFGSLKRNYLQLYGNARYLKL